MLTSLRIQNFRSIRDASVKLGQVNLFIGPNNSGKSNFLKGIEVVASLIAGTNKDGRIGRRNLPKELQNAPYDSPASTTFTVDANLSDNEQVSATTILKDDIPTSEAFIRDNDKGLIKEKINRIPYELQLLFRNTVVYNTNPERLRTNAELKSLSSLSADGTDLVLFLFSLGQNNRPLFKRLEDDLKRCVQDIVSVSTPPDPEEPGKLKLKFFDQNDIGYWAEEVSEGVLYFLAILCIVHQPNPPKLLLLEEPEKGIHPRRIREVMDFIFELAYLRDIQIIITSHNSHVVDHFADIPECISVFDRRKGETIIRNAEDIIAEANEALATQGRSPVRYTDSLGEHWISGFIGGVPA